MSSATFKNILIISVIWLFLYILAVYSVYLALKYGGSHYWATPIWILLYLIPGYLAGYFVHKSWLITGALVGVIGTIIWLLHAQLSITNIGAIINLISNTFAGLLGAWLGQRKAHKQNAL